MLKTFKFLATGSWFGAAVKRCQCTKKHEPLMLAHVGEDGSIKTDGRQNLLKQSGFYPRALGKAIVQAWRRRGPSSHPSAKLSHPLRIHGVTHAVHHHPQQKNKKHMETAAKRTHGMTHGVSKAPVLMIHGLTCRVGE